MIFKKTLFIIFVWLLLSQNAWSQDLQSTNSGAEEKDTLDETRYRMMEQAITKAEKEQEDQIENLTRDFIIFRQDVMDDAMDRAWSKNKFFFIPGQRLTPIFP